MTPRGLRSARLVGPGAWCETPGHSAEGAKHQRLPGKRLGGWAPNSFGTSLLLGWCATLALLPTALAQPEPSPSSGSSSGPSAPTSSTPALTIADYARRARAALDGGKPLLAAQILMLSYQDHGDTRALDYAGLAFQQAGRLDLAIRAWERFVCTSPDVERRHTVRLRLRTLQPKKAPLACKGPVPEDRAPFEANPQMPESQRPPTQARTRGPDASGRGEIAAEESETNIRLELESGARFGNNTFGLIWGPGIWVDSQSQISLGLFVPIFFGERSDVHASIGVEPRVRLALNDEISGEVAVGMHTGDGSTTSRWSYSGGVNFNDVLSVRFTREHYQGTNGPGANFSATFIDASFTGNTGKTIAGIEAGLALIIALLVSGA